MLKRPCLHRCSPATHSQPPQPPAAVPLLSITSTAQPRALSRFDTARPCAAYGLALHTALRCMPGPLAKAMPGPPLPTWVNWEERSKVIAGVLGRAPTVAVLERLPGLAVSTPGFGDLTSFIRKPMSCLYMYVCI